MTNVKAAILLIYVISFTGCSALSSRHAPDKSSSVEMRDVPMEARDGNEAPRHRVLVLPFLDERPDHSKEMTEMARQTVIREMNRTHQFVVVSLDEFPQDPRKYLNEENEYDMAQISKAASGMGVAAVLEGKVLSTKAKRMGDSMGLIRETKAQVSAQVRIRVWAGKNGKEILNEMRSGEADATTTRVAERGDGADSLSNDPDLMRGAIRRAFQGSVPGVIRAIEKLNWEGRVAMVNGERVFVNAGRLSGIQVGDILKVTEEGDDVYDPENGKYIGTAPGRLKGTVEVVSYFGKDGSITVIHSGSGFQENDRVELY